MYVCVGGGWFNGVKNVNVHFYEIVSFFTSGCTIFQAYQQSVRDFV